MVLVLLFQCAIGIVNSENEISSTTIDYESDAIWCPTHRVGNQCAEETLLSFYKCCGHLNKECCFHLRVWVVIMIIVLPLCLILPASTFLFRRLFCAKKEQRNNRAIAAERVRQLAAEDSTIIRRDSDDMVML